VFFSVRTFDMWDSRIKNLGSILLTKGIFAKCLERVIERRGRLFDAPSCSEDPGFKSWPEDRIS
jgi:hypothetical protein